MLNNRNYMSINNTKEKQFNISPTGYQHNQENVPPSPIVIHHENHDTGDFNNHVTSYSPTHEGGGSSSSLSSNQFDGRRGWIVLTGLFIIHLFVALHLFWGVMQDYYIREGKSLSPDKSQIMYLTLVGATFQTLFKSCVFIGTLLYTFIGIRLTLLLGIVLLTGGLLLASFTNSIWQLYITYGLCSGLGSAIISAVGLRLSPMWFKKYRSTTSGILSSAVTGSGIILPPIAERLNVSIGVAWTYRIFALIILSSGLIAYPLIKEPEKDAIKEHQKPKQQRRDLFGFSLLKNLDAVIWIMVGPIHLFSAFIMVVFVPSTVTSSGLLGVQGALCVTVLCAGATVGGATNGLLADKFGNLNIFITSMCVCTLTVFFIWIPAHNLMFFMVFCAIAGVFYPCYFSVSIGLRGITYLFAILGPFVATYLETINSSMPPYFYCKIVAGSGFAVCALLGLIIKLRMDSRVFIKI
ncbi:major facilitator superfamily domain-containing protein [Phascolomyces articulosus]|uniref:Major facilitator superfamily domain-containing protein n=1 Tax=Phascolomyces articulosus TaxID=60185 RepID=A0AAD5K3G5_9FUNG|nr:major facilitator superfamily domain-containing protein [Phascolomyces articulosus]